MDGFRFLIRCSSCAWKKLTNGIQADLQDLKEVTTCSKCSGGRKFKCPQCGMIAKQIRIRGNA